MAHESHVGTHGTEQTGSAHWIEWACKEAGTGSLLEWAGIELTRGKNHYNKNNEVLNIILNACTVFS